MSDEQYDNEGTMEVTNIHGEVSIRDKRGRFVKGSSGCINGNQGRPKGSMEIASKAAVKALEREGLDPIELLAQLLEEAMASGNEELQYKILSRLMDYSYSKAPAMVESKVDANIPMLNVMAMENPNDKLDGDDTQEQEEPRSDFVPVPTRSLQ